MSQETYMMMSDPGGNAIGCWESEEKAMEAVQQVLAAEPEAEGHFIVIEFDPDGMATRVVYPK